MADPRYSCQRAGAELFGPSQSFIDKLLRRACTTRAIAALPYPGGRQAICHDATLVLMRQLAREHADATSAVVEEHLCQQVGSG